MACLFNSVKVVKILINHSAETRFYWNPHSRRHVMNAERESKLMEYNHEIF